MPLLGLREELLQQEDVGVSRVDQLRLHLAGHSLAHGLNDLLDLVQGVGVVIEPDLPGVLEGGLDGLDALGPLVLGELDVGDQLTGVVLIDFLLGLEIHLNEAKTGVRPSYC